MTATAATITESNPLKDMTDQTVLTIAMSKDAKIDGDTLARAAWEIVARDDISPTDLLKITGLKNTGAAGRLSFCGHIYGAVPAEDREGVAVADVRAVARAGAKVVNKVRKTED